MEEKERIKGKGRGSRGDVVRSKRRLRGRGERGGGHEGGRRRGKFGRRHLPDHPIHCDSLLSISGPIQSVLLRFSPLFHLSIPLFPPPHHGLEQPKIQIGVLGHSLVRSLGPLTRSLAPDCSLRSRPPLRSHVRSLAHFAHSLARGKVDD